MGRANTLSRGRGAFLGSCDRVYIPLSEKSSHRRVRTASMRRAFCGRRKIHRVALERPSQLSSPHTARRRLVLRRGGRIGESGIGARLCTSHLGRTCEIGHLLRVCKGLRAGGRPGVCGHGGRIARLQPCRPARPRAANGVRVGAAAAARWQLHRALLVAGDPSGWSALCGRHAIHPLQQPAVSRACVVGASL